MKTKTRIKTTIFSIIALIVGLVFGAGTYALAFSPPSDQLYTVASGELSVHFLELGNQYAGDCIYIKANDKDILIDSGSRQQSATTIINYLKTYMGDDLTLEYLFATHAHQDHIAAFPSTASRKGIFETYEVKNIIDFGNATKYYYSPEKATSVYNNYVSYRTTEINQGAHYAAVSDYNEPTFLDEIDNANKETKTIDLGEGITLKILYNYYYNHKTGNENNYSVCLLLTQGDNNILLTGDLEAEGETKLVENNNLPECVLFKAAHHGSYTGSSDNLLRVIKPKNVVFTCCAGATEYTTNLQNTFPSQQAINNIAKYTSNCYVTTQCLNTAAELTAANPNYSKYASLNGNIMFVSNKTECRIVCSNSDTILKDSTWFKNYNRTWAAA